MILADSVFIGDASLGGSALTRFLFGLVTFLPPALVIVLRPDIGVEMMAVVNHEDNLGQFYASGVMLCLIAVDLGIGPAGPRPRRTPAAKAVRNPKKRV